MLFDRGRFWIPHQGKGDRKGDQVERRHCHDQKNGRVILQLRKERKRKVRRAVLEQQD